MGRVVSSSYVSPVFFGGFFLFSLSFQSFLLTLFFSISSFFCSLSVPSTVLSPSPADLSQLKLLLRKDRTLFCWACCTPLLQQNVSLETSPAATRGVEVGLVILLLAGLVMLLLVEIGVLNKGRVSARLPEGALVGTTPDDATLSACG